MIESIGHTTDGLVWMRFEFEVDGIKQAGMLELAQNAAEWVRDSLGTAIANAKEITDVRNGINTDKVSA